MKIIVTIVFDYLYDYRGVTVDRDCTKKVVSVRSLDGREYIMHILFFNQFTDDADSTPKFASNLNLRFVSNT